MMYDKLPSSPFKKNENITIGNNDTNSDIYNIKELTTIEISKNKYIIDMEHELIKTQKNIENENYNNTNKKMIEILKRTMVQVFTNNKYMINQLKKMDTLEIHNEYGLKRALENIKQLNIICESIYE